METLLSVVRETDKAKNFISYVVRLAQDLKVRIHLMYVQEAYEYTIGQPPAPETYTIDNLKEKEEEAGMELRAIVSEVLEELAGEVSLEYSTELASTISVIDEYYTDNKDGLVVLEGEEQKSILSPGPSVNEIIDATDCPVLIIPENVDYKSFRKIVYATDYKAKDIKTLKHLIELTGKLSPSIIALHVVGKPETEELISEAGFKEMLQAETGYKNLSVELLEADENESAPQLIWDFLLEKNIDLLVMLKENRNFFERISNPDQTKKIMRGAEIPVLIYK
jgi:nucleotide-binding universal stress UspA family protein